VENFRFPKVVSEGNVFGIRDVLPGEDQDEMLHPDFVKFAERSRIERLAHIHAAYLGTECGVQLANRKAGGGFGLSHNVSLLA